MYRQLAAVELTHIPDRGFPPAVQALVADEIQFYITALSSGAGHIQACTFKRAKALLRTLRNQQEPP